MRKDEIPHVAQYETRFWQKVDRRGPKECWPWRGSGSGHGQVYLGLPGYARNQRAHRIAYILTFGELEDSLELLHDCDEPYCCNPTHLIPGTHKENMEDMGRKGRQWKSKTGPKVRLAIRKRFVKGESASSIARDLQLSRHTISRSLNYGRPREKHIRFGPHYSGGEERLTDLKYPERVHKTLTSKSVETESGCWEWTGGTVKGGYGTMNVTLSNGGRQGKGTHRLAYLLAYGYIPPQTVIRHTCNNPPCVNPDHLIDGTHADNMQDMVKAGRKAPPYMPENYVPKFSYKPRPQGYSAETHQYTRLAPEQRAEFRARIRAGEDRDTLVTEYHISQRAASAIMAEDGGEKGQIAPLAQRQRDEEAYALRGQGLSWSKIATQLGVSVMGARKMVLRHGPDPMPEGQSAGRKRRRLDDDPAVVAEAGRLRAEGQTYQQIGEHFVVTASAAYGLVQKSSNLP